MYATIEECEGGFVIEVRRDHAPMNATIMQGKTDRKKVCTTYPEASEYLWKFFVGHLPEDEGA